MPGDHLVLIRYRAGHLRSTEWVYNGHDIPSQRIIWAHDLDPEDSDQPLICHYHDRHVWMLEPIDGGAWTPQQAKEALKPAEVQVAQGRQGLRAEARDRRKNAAYRRQGEWFFLPAPGFAVDESLVLRNEPITRGTGGKPHRVEFCYRTGGETVYVCSRHPNGVTEKEYREILNRSPKAKGWNWQTMRRNPGVYVRGSVRHADHKTIVLHGWHRVLMNTEGQSRAMRNVAFLD